MEEEEEEVGKAREAIRILEWELTGMEWEFVNRDMDGRTVPDEEIWMVIEVDWEERERSVVSHTVKVNLVFCFVRCACHL